MSLCQRPVVPTIWLNWGPQPLLQHGRSRAVPSVSWMVRGNGGRLRGRTRHGSGMGATDLQPGDDVGSADLAANLSVSCGTLRLHAGACRSINGLTLSLAHGRLKAFLIAVHERITRCSEVATKVAQWPHAYDHRPKNEHTGQEQDED